MASFSLKLYTEPVAGHLAILWACRMEYFYNRHLAGNFNDNGQLPSRLLACVPNGDQVRDLLAKLPDNHPVWNLLLIFESTSPPVKYEAASSSSGLVGTEDGWSLG